MASDKNTATSGRDKFYGTPEDDVFFGERGLDTFYASAGTDELWGIDDLHGESLELNIYDVQHSPINGESIHVQIDNLGHIGWVDKINDGHTDSIDNLNYIIASKDSTDDQLTLASSPWGDDDISPQDLSEFTDQNVTGTFNGSAFGAPGQQSLQDIIDSNQAGDITINGTNMSGSIGNVGFENFEQISANLNPNAAPADDVVVCFTKGTMIETEKGEKPVEKLEIGDRVRTYDRGYQPVRFIYKSTVLCVGDDRPVLFETNAIGNSRPLRVSQKHRIFTNGMAQYFAQIPLSVMPSNYLICADELCNGENIRIDDSLKTVTYVHIMFDQHELVFTHGVVSESWQPLRRNLDRDQNLRRELLRIFPEIRENTPQNKGAAVREPIIVSHSQ